MALKLMLGKGDKILIGDDVICEILSSGRRAQIAIHAPQSTKIIRIPANIEDYARNAHKRDQDSSDD